VGLCAGGVLMADLLLPGVAVAKGSVNPSKPAVVKVGSDPAALAFTPNSKTVYIVNQNSGTVTPIALGPKKAGPAIAVGGDPDAIAISPNGQTAYVTNSGSGTVTPITTATNKAGQPIPVGDAPSAIVLSSENERAYVADSGSAAVTPIDLTTGKALTSIIRPTTERVVRASA